MARIIVGDIITGDPSQSRKSTSTGQVKGCRQVHLILELDFLATGSLVNGG